MFQRLRKTFWGVSDLTPAHRDKTTGVHGVGTSEIDSVENREIAIGNLANYLAILVRMLLNEGTLEEDAYSGDDDDLNLKDILDKLETLAQKAEIE